LSNFADIALFRFWDLAWLLRLFSQAYSYFLAFYRLFSSHYLVFSLNLMLSVVLFSWFHRSYSPQGFTLSILSSFLFLSFRFCLKLSFITARLKYYHLNIDWITILSIIGR
jgi:hypothetical protein